MEMKQPFEIPHEGDESTRAARRRIDDNIDELKRRVHSLRMERNELSSISVLPPEILSKIFIFVRELPLYLLSYIRETNWIHVGHVCHRWREVALGCSSLWSVPVFSRPDLAQEMIYRSKMAALTIFSVRSSAPTSSKQLENAMTQISRIQSIHLDLGGLEALDAIFSSLLLPAPLLERVTFSGPPTELARQYSFSPKALLDAPRLQSIEFVNLTFSWNSAIFQHKNLTVLRLKNDCATMSGDSTIGQMMDVLHLLPNLRILELANSIPPHTTGNGNEKILEFKFLKQLALRTEAVDCIFFLRHIRYPPCTAVQLGCLSTGIEDCKSILALTSQYLHCAQSAETEIPPSPIIIRSAQLAAPCMSSFHIAFSEKVEVINTGFDSSSLLISIRLFPLQPPVQMQGRFLRAVYDSFDLSSLETLSINFNFTHEQIYMFQDSFGRLPKLNLIHVARSLPQICLALVKSSEEIPFGVSEESKNHYPLDMQPTFPPRCVFPALRTLLIERADLLPQRRLHQRQPENMELLVDMLMKRSDMSVPIEKLLLDEYSGVGNLSKRRLGELVVDLEVKGELIDVNSMDDDEEEEEEEEENDYSVDYFYDDDSYSLDPVLGWLSDI